jgi:hypothetical protein
VTLEFSNCLIFLLDEEFIISQNMILNFKHIIIAALALSDRLTACGAEDSSSITTTKQQAQKVCTTI